MAPGDRSQKYLSDLPRPRDALVPLVAGVLARALVVLWAGTRFPPVGDGRFYHLLATRLAEGQGYTWRWPDGVVTYVAHYPVGYPALASFAYRVLGSAPLSAMVLNASIGSLAVLAAHRIAAEVAGRFGALFAAFAVALHPALVFYTPALMTEGVTAALLAVAGALAVIAAQRSGRARFGLWLVLGAVLGTGALIRGQTLLFAPLFGALAAGASGARKSLAGAATITVVAALVVLPWTLRNCQRMDRCVVVSANLGWNLWIGATPGATGTFVPIEGGSVPSDCRTVFGEAEKDECFARAAVREARSRPGDWLALVPKKLAYTFEYCGAAGWYLNASNAEAFPKRAKLQLGVVETVVQRGLLALGLWAMARAEGPRTRLRRGIALAGALTLLAPFGWLAWVALLVGALALGAALLRHAPLALAGAAVGATALTHSVFFGAGRYSLPVFALIAALAGTAWPRRRAAEAQSPPAF